MRGRTEMRKDLTWREVFDPKTPMLRIEQAMDAAAGAGYRYFAWQGGVYTTDPGSEVELRRAVRVGAVGDVL